MKRILILLLASLFFYPNICAQLAVLDNGQIVTGSPDSNLGIYKNASINIWDNDSNSGGTISFGAGPNVMIGGDGLNGKMNIKASELFKLLVGNDVIAMSCSEPSKLFTFNYYLKAPGYLTISDARYKTNICALENSHSKLFGITPVSYNVKYPLKSDSLYCEDKDTRITEKYLEDEKTHYGFIAQEVKEIFPELVMEDEEGTLSIDYTGFIPLLLNAYKDLSEKVSEQKDFIDNIKDYLNLKFPESISQEVDNYNLKLMQNNPNPFHATTTIECYLADELKTASLNIYDLQGAQVMSKGIRERGDIKVIIDGMTIKPGIYIYCIIADGIASESKRMIVTD